MGKRYDVTYEKDEDGMWVAVIDRAQGVSCVAQGRSLGEARRRIRSALGVYLDDVKAAQSAELRDEVKLAPAAKAAVAKALREREKAQRAQELSMQTASTAAEALTRLGLSRRDAAELLGVSHQRVQQFSAQVAEVQAGLDKREKEGRSASVRHHRRAPVAAKKAASKRKSAHAHADAN